MKNKRRAKDTECEKKTRMTIQKMRILEYLKSVRTHPTAEMVYKAVSKDLPTITLATVYRNLNQLAANRQILRFEVGKEYRYDGYSCCHIHCICRKCGKIIDKEDKKKTMSLMETIDKKEFVPDTVDVMLFGLCGDCSKEKK